MNRLPVSVAVIALLAVGCRRDNVQAGRASSAPPGATGESSTAETVIDGVTGRGVVRVGRQAEERVRAISAQERKDLDDVLRDK